MTYVPKNWVTGEVITEEALDHIEQGIASVVLHVVQDENTATLDKTWQEIHDAVAGGSVVTISKGAPDAVVYQMRFVTALSSDGGSYSITDSSEAQYVASSADGYPARDFG